MQLLHFLKNTFFSNLPLKLKCFFVFCSQDNCTALHAAVSSGHVGPLKLLLYHSSPEPDLGLPTSPSDPNQELQHHGRTKASQILNHSNQDGWTAAHIAASRGYKVTCLMLNTLLHTRKQELEETDKHRWCLACLRISWFTEMPGGFV